MIKKLTRITSRAAEPRLADPWKEPYTVRVRYRTHALVGNCKSLADARKVALVHVKDVGVRDVSITKMADWPSRDRLVVARAQWLKKTSKLRWTLI